MHDLILQQPIYFYTNDPITEDIIASTDDSA